MLINHRHQLHWSCATMPFHVKRSQTAHLETLSQYNGIRSTRWERPPGGLAVHEIQTTHTPTALQKVPDDQNYLTPPYHCKWMRNHDISGSHADVLPKGTGIRMNTFMLRKGTYCYIRAKLPCPMPLPNLV